MSAVRERRGALMGVSQLNTLLEAVLDRGGSDLHITVGVPPVMRRNGALVRMEGPSLTSEDTQAILFPAMSDPQREALERKLEHDFAYALPTHARFRVNAYFQRGSVGAAFRQIPSEVGTFEQLGLPHVVSDLALKPRGLVLVTGPTGSGKSTTLAAMVDHINENREVHIMTLEDPVEYLHSHKRAMVNQREVGSDTRSFADGLKHVLRQDPDVILVGEMRDLETMRAAMTAAETGHLVLTTLHTQGAPQTVDRVIDVFPPHQQSQVRVQLAATLQGIMSQQLLPNIQGSGQVVACEVLIPTSAVRNLIREGKTHQLPSAMETGYSHGMVTMDRALADLVRRGSLGRDAALQRAQDGDVVRALLDQGS